MKQTRVNGITLSDVGRQIIKILGLGKKDVQTANQIAPFGFDSAPVKEMVAIQAPTGVRGESVIVGFIQKDLIATPGESRVFSTNADGVLQIALHLRDNGQMEIGGTGDFLARFDELKAGYDELKGDLNAFITKYNTHIHVTTATVGATAVPGVIAPTVTTEVPSTASIDSAKIDELEVSDG